MAKKVEQGPRYDMTYFARDIFDQLSGIYLANFVFSVFVLCQCTTKRCQNCEAVCAGLGCMISNLSYEDSH